VSGLSPFFSRWPLVHLEDHDLGYAILAIAGARMGRRAFRGRSLSARGPAQPAQVRQREIRAGSRERLGQVVRSPGKLCGDETGWYAGLGRAPDVKTGTGDNRRWGFLRQRHRAACDPKASLWVGFRADPHCIDGGSRMGEAVSLPEALTNPAFCVRGLQQRLTESVWLDSPTDRSALQAGVLHLQQHGQATF